MGGDRDLGTAILLSGGLDSTALAWWKQPDIAITIDYGQRSAKGEIRAATAVARELHIRHQVLAVDCSTLGSGDLSKHQPLSMAPASDWWPYRNQLLVTLAAAKAITMEVDSLLVGSVAHDGYHADGTADFYQKLDRLLASQEGGMRVRAPAITLTSIELIRRSGIPPSILAWAHSCHTGEYACGSCRGCQKHFTVTEEIWGEGF